MGISPSILSVARTRELTSKHRWPSSLQSVGLTQLCQWYTIFRELGSVQARPKHLAVVMEVSEADMMCAAEIWEIGRDDHLNIWELLTLMAATSQKLSMNTKLAFFFRMWDVDQDGKLHSAELAFLLRALLYSLASFCSCDRSQLPDPGSIRKYVERTFKSKTSEDGFISWALRYRLLKTTLQAFTPPPKKDAAVELLDFVLSGPKDLVRKTRRSSTGGGRMARQNSTRSNSSSRSGLVDSPDFQAEGDSSEEPDIPKAKAADAAPQRQISSHAGANFALPAIGEGEECEEEDEELSDLDRQESKGNALMKLPRFKKLFNHTENEPVNCQPLGVLLGQLRLLEEVASRADAQHYCPLHGPDEELCMPLSKSEVLLASRLWHFFKKNRDMESQAVDEMIERLQAEVYQHDSILAQSEHRNIFLLMNRHSNRSFKVAIKRLREGSRVLFLDFLRAACPCASEARIRLYNYWHVHVFWNQEAQFTELVQKWREDFEDTKDSSELGKTTTPRGGFSFLEQMSNGRAQSKQDVDPNERILTLEDLVTGDVILQSVATEMMQKHENLTVDTEFGVQEFMEVFVQGGARKVSVSFEQTMRVKFERLAAGHRKIRRPLTGRNGSKRDGSKRDGSKRDGSKRSSPGSKRAGSKRSYMSKRSSISGEDEEEENESGFPLYELLGDADVAFAFNLLSSCEDDFADHDDAPRFSEASRGF